MNILEEIQNCPIEWKELGDKNVAKLSRGKVMSKQFLEENKQLLQKPQLMDPIQLFLEVKSQPTFTVNLIE